jgi:hypothetical protein
MIIAWLMLSQRELMSKCNLLSNRKIGQKPHTQQVPTRFAHPIEKVSNAINSMWHQFSFERGTFPYFLLSIIFSPFISNSQTNEQWPVISHVLLEIPHFFISTHWIFFLFTLFAVLSECEGVRVNKEGERMAQEGMLHTHTK